MAALAAAAAVPVGADPRPDLPPNVVLIVTDDQGAETFPSQAMPWLRSRVLDPAGHWVLFPNAFVNTPLCCPSRASILTGRYSRHTGVRYNHEGEMLDETRTLATWLRDAGYHTMLVGKYLNGFPFGRPPYAPRGWDRFLAKGNDSGATVYVGYPLYEGGVPFRVGDAPGTYVTDLLADRATAYLRVAPSDRPFFLYFAPPAPHSPWIPPPRYEGRFAELAVPGSPAVDEADVSDKPAWVRALPPLDAPARAALLDARRRERETLLAVDDAIRRIFETLEATGELRRTIVVFTSDNGYSFGEHRLVGKRCPYDACTRVPFAAYVPWAEGSSRDQVVSNVDIAPTLAAIAGAAAVPAPDGIDLSCALDPGPACPLPSRDGVFIEYAGDPVVPAYAALRTGRFLYVEYGDGDRELYDASLDPYQLENVAAEPRYASEGSALAALLQRLRGG